MKSIVEMFQFAFSAGMTRANWSRRTVTRATSYGHRGQQPPTIGVISPPGSPPDALGRRRPPSLPFFQTPD